MKRILFFAVTAILLITLAACATPTVPVTAPHSASPEPVSTSAQEINPEPSGTPEVTNGPTDSLIAHWTSATLSLSDTGSSIELDNTQLSDLKEMLANSKIDTPGDYPYIFSPMYAVKFGNETLYAMYDDALYYKDENPVTIIAYKSGDSLRTAPGVLSALLSSMLPDDLALQTKMSALHIFASADDADSAAKKLISKIMDFQAFEMGGVVSYAIITENTRLDMPSLSQMAVYNLLAYQMGFDLTIERPDADPKTKSYILDALFMEIPSAMGTRLYLLGYSNPEEFEGKLEEFLDGCSLPIRVFG